MRLSKKLTLGLLTFAAAWMLSECLLYIGLTYYKKSKPEYSYPQLFMKTPHPYLGFTDEDFPTYQALLDRQANTQVFHFGIFGGSVARQVCEFLNEQEALHLYFGFLTENKKIKLFCFAIGGGRQPQQSIAFSLYGRHLDFALFIEGSNEVGRRFEIRNSPEFPSADLSQLWFAEWGQRFWANNFSYFFKKWHTWSVGTPQFFALPSIEVFREISLLIHDSLHDRLEEDTLSHTNIGKIDVKTKYEIWRQGIQTANVLSRHWKVPMLTVIQPQLHFKRVKTQAEQRHYHSSWNYHQGLSGEFFLKFADAAHSDDDVFLYDASMIFKDVEDSSFIDDIHLNDYAINIFLIKIISFLKSQEF